MKLKFEMKFSPGVLSFEREENHIWIVPDPIRPNARTIKYGKTGVFPYLSFCCNLKMCSVPR